MSRVGFFLGTETELNAVTEESGAEAAGRVSARASTMRDGVISSPGAVWGMSTAERKIRYTAIRKHREPFPAHAGGCGDRWVSPDNQSISMTSFTEPRIPASSGISAGTMLTWELNERNPRS